MSISKILSISAAALGALSLSIASAQTTATTTPVGFITLTFPAGTDAAPNYTPISVPMYQASLFQGGVASIDGAGMFSLTGASFGNLTATPYLAHVKSGTLAGRFWKVSANTATQLTVVTPTGVAADLTGLAANDSCEVVPANTLTTVFGAGATLATGIGGGTTATNSGVDNVLLWNGSSFDTYYYNNSPSKLRWQKGIADATNAIIYPDDGMFYGRRAASPLTITIMGTVPSTVESSYISGSANNFVANRFPIDVQLGVSSPQTLPASGIENTPGWVKGTSAGGSDNVLLWNSGTGSWDTYYFNSTNNRWQKAIVNASTTPIPAGTSFFMVRTTATSSVLTQNLPYTLP